MQEFPANFVGSADSRFVHSFILGGLNMARPVGSAHTRSVDLFCRTFSDRLGRQAVTTSCFVLDLIAWNGLYLRFHRRKGTTKREGGKIKSVKKSGFPPSLMVFPLHSLSFTYSLSRFFLLIFSAMTCDAETFLVVISIVNWSSRAA